ncbi:MAG: coproporphyrinogen III oxidase [Pelotomaculum sp. PtaB.Bin013]|uniref:TIGR01212 family radical SAM protein n=1 Tax=Pelotomaculum isophthalicicum JI TaxID=947010 RepID=A0A9X4H625_9FIRM|nr:TIGR01212 family radical SAM protein [Pelotomaculum isophthalicicum]MDF9408573.1 TIGR01212 family radical SAM protein [Pelotomaculum isophthalicicum JI]OPX83161.1 MAG: coproporphyrinogen III oxidase [Pelotomaculum sp. PtaB.Bin013]
MNAALYNRYSEHLVKKYGKKVYKLPINLPGTCPNRDGKVGEGGCIFCDEQGSGFDCLSNMLSVKLQLKENKEYFSKRFKAEKFIAYFQAFTNTYQPFELFRDNILETVTEDDLVAISISTRPDCVNDCYLDFLQEVRNDHKIDISIELGLQTVNYHTLVRVNRGHTLAEFIDAVNRIKARDFDVCAHLILNLPGDNYQDAVENAKVLSALRVDYAKLHSLYVVGGTPLGDMYQKGRFEIISMQEYIERVACFLEYLDPGIVIQRLVGKGPKDNLLFCNWGVSWWLVKKKIEDYMEGENIYQGKKFDYLNGKALKGMF